MELGQAVVALESTLISHGLPWPENQQIAVELEDIVRREGAVPATIAIMHGKIKVGLSPSELELLAKMGEKVWKVSRRDVALVLAQGTIGATTVSATSLIAAKCGIHLFATGGIGGVHRDGHITMDISADLTELGRTPICVVSAGIKSILDIGRTLEYLETQGVTVVGYGTDAYPSFFTEKSGFKAPCRLNTPQQCANLVYHNLALQLNSGILISVPIPRESAADGMMVEEAIVTALKETEQKNIIGREITPYILKRVAHLTGGISLEANLSLIRNNVKVASQIAIALADMKRNKSKL
uniref:Pseudouridine-5'-phosphate glycosidase n=1 Tax=Arcella intermedia TaxID=1963864 RepID=A0A6B2LAY7_9EUKA